MAREERVRVADRADRRRLRRDHPGRARRAEQGTDLADERAGGVDLGEREVVELDPEGAVHEHGDAVAAVVALAVEHVTGIEPLGGHVVGEGEDLGGHAGPYLPPTRTSTAGP